MTVLEGIQKSAQFFAGKGIDSPRLQAELLLAHVLKLPRMQLYLRFERVLTTAETQAFREAVLRRSRREPFQYITGSTSFCGLELAVNPHVLIPRPETELLAEAGWEFLQHLSRPAAEPATTLDFGTGSGCLALTLAAKCPTARIVASDISADAIAVATRNATALHVADRIEFIIGEGLAHVPDSLRFDLIITNPPYVPTAEIQSLEPEVRDFEPRRALDGGADGLDVFRQLAAQAGARLKSGGRLMAEFGDNQAEPVATLFKNQNWIVEAVRPDYTRRPRILVARV